MSYYVPVFLSVFLAVPCVCVCVCANCFVFLEIKNIKTEYFLIRVSLADLGSIE